MVGTFFMMLGIDVVLGPLLTPVVYSPAKKSLRFDLAVIVLLQLVAFGYGLATIAQGRPAWYVFAKDRFDLVQAMSLDQRYLDDTRPEYRKAPWSGPRWVAAVPPRNHEKPQVLLIESIAGGSDLPQRIDLYVPLADELASMKAKAHELPELSRYNPQDAVDDVLKRWPKANAWLPLKARITDMTVLIDMSDGAIVAVVDLRPWD